MTETRSDRTITRVRAGATDWHRGQHFDRAEEVALTVVDCHTHGRVVRLYPASSDDRVEFDPCEHSEHQWTLVYQCNGCGGIAARYVAIEEVDDAKQR